MATGRSLQLRDFEMWVDDRGQGSPLLLLHGFTGSSADWQTVFVDYERLAHRWRVVAPDLRGHGRSTNPGGRFSIRACAEDVFAALERLGIERFHAIGMSLGAKTLLHMAVAQPDRIKAMVLVSATPRFPEPTRVLMTGAAQMERREAEWEVMRGRHRHGDDQIRALWSLTAALAEQHEEMHLDREALARIAAPTLIVHGDRDPFYPVELAVELYRAMPNSWLMVSPDGGHLPIFHDAKPGFVAAASAFLERTDPRSARAS